MKETIGKISSDLLGKQADDTHSAHEQMQECLTDYDTNMAICVNRGFKRFNSDFFIVMVTKKERLMPNVLRNYFLDRLTCPTPDYDQTVYKYKKGAGIVEFLWTIPSKDTCIFMKENALEIPLEQRELLKFVLEFADGTLFKKSKKLNKEQDDSPLLITAQS